MKKAGSKDLIKREPPDAADIARARAWDAEKRRRFASALSMWERGLTQKEIGDRLGVTRQRAAKLCEAGLVLRHLIQMEKGA